MGAIINEKIIEFGANNALNIVGQYGRDRRARQVKHYAISTENGIAIGRIEPDCSYEQFLEVVARGAISEAERRNCVSEAIWETNEELCKELEFYKSK